MISKKDLGDFEELSIFNSEYILVKRNGLFNLINQFGNYVSKTWYEQITKNGDGADFVMQKTQERIQLRSVGLLGAYHTIRETLNNTNILHRLDTRCIVVCNPYKIHCVSLNRPITIIAKVNVLGNEYLLGKNGKLYNEDGTEYILPNFSISLTDINRLVELTDLFNYSYSTTFRASQKDNSNTVEAITKNGISGWAFGFDAQTNMEYDTCNKLPIRHLTIKPWGDDSIKFRINIELIPETYRDEMINHLKAMDFSNSYDKHPGWWTREYEPEELSDLYDDIQFLTDKKNFIKG